MAAVPSFPEGQIEALTRLPGEGGTGRLSRGFAMTGV